jgi:hypothetical protein
VLATLLSSASVASFFWSSMNTFGTGRPREIVGLLLFCGIGLASVAWADSIAFTSRGCRNSSRSSKV